jgi:hypothetical protein
MPKRGQRRRLTYATLRHRNLHEQVLTALAANLASTSQHDDLALLTASFDSVLPSKHSQVNEVLARVNGGAQEGEGEVILVRRPVSLAAPLRVADAVIRVAVNRRTTSSRASLQQRAMSRPLLAMSPPSSASSTSSTRSRTGRPSSQLSAHKVCNTLTAASSLVTRLTLSSLQGLTMWRPRIDSLSRWRGQPSQLLRRARRNQSTRLSSTSSAYTQISKRKLATLPVRQRSLAPV